jgi:helix-turn-helix protein
MDDTLCRRFFAEPTSTYQRQYEAIRAVIVNDCPQQEAAQRFGYSPGAFRQLLRQFRAGCTAGTPPPFSPNPDADDFPSATIPAPLVQTFRRQPTAKCSHSRPVEG